MGQVQNGIPFENFRNNFYNQPISTEIENNLRVIYEDAKDGELSTYNRRVSQLALARKASGK